MSRTIHLALHPYGVGGPGQHGLWKDPRVAKNASIDINYYIRLAQAAEHALFDALFIVDSQFINATYRRTTSTGWSRSPCCPRSPPTPGTSAWWAPQVRRTTRPSTSPGGSRPSTTSAAAAPAGTW